MSDLKTLGEAQWAPPLKRLRALSDDDLIRYHDALIESEAARPVVSIAYYLDELARRGQERQTRTVVRLTWAIAAMTLANVVVAVALLVQG